jgi:short-subunit dehydrogenase
MNNQANNGKIALITGASAGIGYELAQIFAKNGYDLILTARSEQKLEEIARQLQEQFNIKVYAMPVDLSDSRAPEHLFRQVQGAGLHVQVLVNNAGFGGRKEFARADWNTLEQMIQVNITALTHLTRLFLPAMIAKESGKILNIASTAAFFSGPLMAVYYATKAYVLSFSEAIANELKGTGVRVTCFCPGATRTGFQQRAGMTGTRLFRMTAMNAPAVAQAAYNAMAKGKTLAIPGWLNRLTVLFGRFIPRSMLPPLVRWFQE